VKREPFPPLGRPLAKVVLGTSELVRQRPDVALALLAEWLGLGGNVLDTAAVYGDGESERIIGRFLEAAHCRPDVVLITKGCHPAADGLPRVTPAAIHDDLAASLARLRTDFADIYMLHRDDPAVAVGPILEALNAEVAAGRARSIGASNWATGRLEEAREFARRHGMVGFCSSSCQLSLAVQREPMASGCLSVHDPGGREFHRRTQMPLFAWAALAGGWFRGGAGEDPETVRVYGSAENRGRLLRASRFAAEAGLSTAQVALAWVANQPFPCFPVFASRSSEHLREAARAADIFLDAAALAWLDGAESASREAGQ